MKDPQIAFKERLENIWNLIKDEQYMSCYNIAKNLTNFSWTVELKDEVFIGEILEALFKEMGDLIEEYKIPKEIREELKTKLSSSMAKLVEKYPRKNPTELYDCLKELRYTATYYQLNAWQKYPEINLDRYRMNDQL